jgi:hypothetical protein
VIPGKLQDAFVYCAYNQRFIRLQKAKIFNQAINPVNICPFLTSMPYLIINGTDLLIMLRISSPEETGNTTVFPLNGIMRLDRSHLSDYFYDEYLKVKG